jgi:tetratricopeptide (TPR) repeat protein
VVDLPQGGTVLDFAYHVHTEVGHRCRGAKVNGRMVPLNFKPNSGDRVEIMTSKTGEPRRDWLQANNGFLVSGRARDKVRAWFHKVDRERNLQAGREMLEKELRRVALLNADLAPVLEKFHLPAIEDLHLALALGDVGPSQISRALHDHAQAEQPKEAPKPAPVRRKSDTGQQFTVEGVGNLMTQLARCCQPVPGDAIVGYLTRGRGVSIHREGCASAQRLLAAQPERFLPVNWGDAVTSRYEVNVQVRAYDRKWLLKDLTNIVAQSDVNILSIGSQVDSASGLAELGLALKVSDYQQLSELLARLSAVPGVQDARRLVPDSRMNQQLEMAQAALSRGELSRGDGRGARELFEAALAIDPDQSAARDGLLQVRDAAIARASLSLRERKLASARRDLALAKELSAPAVTLQPLQAKLHDLEYASGDVRTLLEQASRAGLPDKQALALYEQVLVIAPENPRALEARGELLARWLVDAGKLIRSGDVVKAQALVAEVVAHDPAHLDLPAVQADLGGALLRVRRQQAQLLAIADGQLRQGRLRGAATGYRRVLALGADPGASDGLQRCAALMAAQAERQAADFDFDRAMESLALAREWSPDSPAVASAARRVTQSRLAQHRLGGVPKRQDRSRLPELLRQAQQALDRGDYLVPPGESAWDQLRIAGAIAPQDKRVRQLQASYRQRTRACFEQAMSDSKLLLAQSCLDARLALDPADDARAARHRLAEGWLGVAEERIAASDYAAATRALASARQLEPGNARGPALRARLQRAQGQPP